MISEETLLVLSRLTKGAKKLSESEVRDLIVDIQGADASQIVEALFAPKPKAKPARVPTPEWLKAMQLAQKRMSWKAPEAVDKLYSLAESAGYSTEKARKKSFPAAAKDIASKLGEESTKDLFVRWVDDFVANHTMV